MKGFQQSLIREVVLRHGRVSSEEASEEAPRPLTHEELRLVLRQQPVGYAALLEEKFYPPPIEYVNGKAQPLAPAAESAWRARLNLCLLARSLGDQLETPAPGEKSKRSDWDLYATKVLKEFEEAGLVEGDLTHLFQEFFLLSKGVGSLGK